jgi:UDPglucose 6-dehydrogenase
MNLTNAEITKLSLNCYVTMKISFANELAALLENCRSRMEFTTDYEYAVRRTNITLIIVPTPSDSAGRFSNVHIETVLDQIAPALKDKGTFHVVDIVSTVMPTTCERIFARKLEALTGKTCSRDFGLVYNPEFIALGSVIHDFLHPDMLRRTIPTMR